MLLINFLCVFFFSADGSKPETFLSMAHTGPHSGVQFHLSDRMTLRLFQVDENGNLTKQRSFVISRNKERIWYTRATPQGNKLVPAWNLLGLEGYQAILFSVAENRLAIIDLEQIPDTLEASQSLLFPRNPKAVFKQKNRFLLVASLITTLNCNQCSCDYFHLVDENWQSTRCFGKGKSFKESFMKGDIPIPFWSPASNRGGIYYTSTKDLYLFDFDGKETLQKTTFPSGGPEKAKLHLQMMQGKPALLTRTESELRLYILTHSQWSLIQTWQGRWASAILLESAIATSDQKGELSTFQLPTVAK